MSTLLLMTTLALGGGEAAQDAEAPVPASEEAPPAERTVNLGDGSQIGCCTEDTVGPKSGESHKAVTEIGDVGARDERYAALAAVVVERHRHRLKFCYQRHLAQSDPSQGTVTLELLVADNGQVATTTVASSTLGSPAVEACLLEAAGLFVFPRPANTKKRTVVTVPIAFRIATPPSDGP